jgi:sugar lactone lactonase YvrE
MAHVSTLVVALLAHFTILPEAMNVLDYLPRCQLAEGVVWDHRHQHLLFVDIEGCTVFIVDVSQKSYQAFNFNEKTCWIQLTTDPNFYLVGLQTSLAILNRHTGSTQLLQSVLNQSSTDRLNDAYVDKDGRVWFGTMSQKHPRQASGHLFSFDSLRGLVSHDQHYQIANGPIAIHQGHSMIHNDSALHQMYRYDLFHDEQGQHLSNRSLFRDFQQEEWSPDGMTIDSNDHIWLALWNGWRVQCLDSHNAGTLLDLKVPARYPTKPCFGSAQLNTLYVSSAMNVNDSDDFGGCIFEFDNLSFHGQPAHLFQLS